MCPCQSRPGDLEVMSFMRMVSTSMKESLIFRTNSAYSPQAEFGPWLVHKRRFDRVRIFLPRRRFCGTRPRLVQMGFSANNVCVVICLFMCCWCPYFVHSVALCVSKQRDWSDTFVRYLGRFLFVLAPFYVALQSSN